MIVAEIKSKKSTDREDWHILSNSHHDNTQVTYILSLGVFKELRRLGIGWLFNEFGILINIQNYFIHFSI